MTVQEENRTEVSQIAVRVLFFGAARDAVGKSEVMFSLSNATNAATAFEQVLDAFPTLRRFGRSLLFAVNEEYARPDREVFAGDELAVFPSVSGGSHLDAETRGKGDRETKMARTLGPRADLDSPRDSAASPAEHLGWGAIPAGVPSRPPPHWKPHWQIRIVTIFLN